MISIIIPTYIEKENIAILIPRIFNVLRKNKIKAEVIIVDDNSPDGTALEAKKLSKKYNVKIICRKNKSGLSSAVLAGFEHAKGNILGVMDADLSHPPEKIPEMVKALDKYNIVIGSRHVNGGLVKDWQLSRKIISKTASIFSKPITNVKDPLSGFFFIKRNVLNPSINPRGFKIGLEILVKGGHAGRIKEIPITFQDRKHGKSKLGNREIINYIIHLLSLYKYKITK